MNKILVLALSTYFCCSIQSSQASTSTNNINNDQDNIKFRYDDPTDYFKENSLSSLFNQRASFDDYITYSLRALQLVAGYDNDLHRYDKKRDLVSSFARNLSYTDDLSQLRARIDVSESELLDDESELTLIENEINQAQCGRHLDILIKESQKVFSTFQSFSTSKQLNLLELVDSFGSPTAQLMKGNSMWLGSHEQCIKSKLISLGKDKETFGTRYCVSNFRSPLWKTDQTQQVDRLGSLSVKLGVCLPESCNSISILRHGKQIESLVKLVRLNQIPYSSYKLKHLFCLPDEHSPLRQFSLSARLFILLIASWLSLVIYFSLKYEYLRFRWLLAHENSTKLDSNVHNLIKVFAFRLSWQNLFGCNKNVSAIEKKSKQSDASQVANRKSIAELNCKESNILTALRSQFQIEPTLNKDKTTPDELHISAVVNVDSSQISNKLVTKFISKSAINLSVIDGIKVLSMIWLISAHTLLFFIRSIANGRDFWSILRDGRYMTVIAGIFPVDTFFTVTGILTAYLKFSKNDKVSINTISYWLEAFVHRYLRFMPMYLIVFWYTRDVSEYIGFGPLWDYATADTSLRSVCKQESVTVPLFFQANFKPIDQHCVKPAWYLANDYQYLLLTPLFMCLLLRYKLLGYATIVLIVACSLVLQFLTVFYSHDLNDFEALINFKPMFGTYVLRNLWKLYVLPYNRIVPYLIGILTGHLMFNHSRSTIAEKEPTSTNNQNKIFNQSQESLATIPSHHHDSTSDILKGSSTKQQNSQTISLTGSFSSYICIKVWTPLVFLISIIYLPMLTKISTQEGFLAKIGTSSIMALMRFVWSIAIARLIYICATRTLENNLDKYDSFVIRFLSSSKWKPWSKIGLSALLIQWEIISYLAQSQTSAPNMTITYLLAIILICIAATYSLALLIYLTIEYPLSQVEQLYIHPIFFQKR